MLVHVGWDLDGFRRFSAFLSSTSSISQVWYSRFAGRFVGFGSFQQANMWKNHEPRHRVSFIPQGTFSGCVCREFMGERTQKPVMERAYLRLVTALTCPKELISWVHLSLNLNGRWFSGVDLETMGWFNEPDGACFEIRAWGDGGLTLDQMNDVR